MNKGYWLAGIGPGWHPLVTPLIERCEAEGVMIHQVKEKFGGLRFYTGDGSDSLFMAIEAAEHASQRICEECGQPGQPRGKGWIKTLCDQHAKDHLV